MITRFRVAVVGAGPRGHALVRALVGHPDAQLVGVCDRKLARARRSVDGLFRVDAFDDVATLLRACRPEVVVVATPPSFQADIAVTALNAGCHVLVECPMVTDAAQADAVRSAAERGGRHAALAESFCYFPAVLAMRRELSVLRGIVLGGEGWYLEMDSSAPAARWRGDLEMSRYLTHGLGPLLHLTDDRATVVTGIEPLNRRSRRDGPLQPVALVQTAAGAVHYVASSGLAPRPVTRWNLTGEWWSLESDPAGAYQGEIRVYRHDSGKWTTVPTRPAELYGDLWGLGREPERLMLRRFLAAVAGGLPDLSLEASLNIALAGAAAAESARAGGRPVPVPAT